MKKPLVSILTPCYNGEKYIDKYFQSILAQTYNCLELIFVNDGSTDKTEEIALSYKEKLERKGIIYKYVRKQNGGQASAMNVGFSLVTGEYLIWPDSDDYLSPDSVEKRVAYLENNPQIHWCRTDAVVICAETGKEIRRFAVDADKKTKDIYLDLIVDSTYCCCGAYMLRFSKFKKMCPSLHIYEGRQGQNWQIQLPFAAKYPCGYVDEGLYYYVIHQDSHSHSQIAVEEVVARYQGLEELLYMLVEDIGRSDRNYKRYIDIKVIRTRLDIYSRFNEKKKAKEYYKKLIKIGDCKDFDRAKYLKKFEPINFFFFWIGSLIKGAFRKIIKALEKNENS